MIVNLSDFAEALSELIKGMENGTELHVQFRGIKLPATQEELDEFKLSSGDTITDEVYKILSGRALERFKDFCIAS